MVSFQVREMVAARDAARGFSSLVDRLRTGEAERFVIVHRNRPEAVLLSVSDYESLLEAAGLIQRAA